MTDFLLLAFVFLIAGVVAVPIAARLGLGSVLGYLIAGIVISPFLAWLHVDVISIQHFAEFGVVMMLFLVGLELEPKLLWSMRAKLLGLGGGQVLLTTLAVMAIAMGFGLVWSVALAVGLVMALSSTAIVLQTLSEKGLMKSDGGQSTFSVLLFQDIAVIPMLALVPLLFLVISVTRCTIAFEPVPANWLMKDWLRATFQKSRLQVWSWSPVSVPKFVKAMMGSLLNGQIINAAHAALQADLRSG